MTTETLAVLTLDEKRQSFVRQRFGQVDVFGDEDFEAYVHGLAHATNLLNHDVATLKRLLRLLIQREQPTDLFNYATPLSVGDLDRIPLDWIEQPEYMRTAARAIFERMMPRTGTTAYWGCMDVLALLVTPDAQSVGHYGTLRAHPHFKTLLDSSHEVLLNLGMGNTDIVEVIFAEWYRGWPKAEVARDHCIACLRERIRAERERAEWDFNTAVAVSANGRKIVHADEVHIGRYALAHFAGVLWEHFKTIPASACFQRKITRADGELVRFKDTWETVTKASTNIKQGMILNDSGKRVFFTTKEFCPPELLA